MHIKYAAVAHLVGGQFLRATANWAKFLILFGSYESLDLQKRGSGDDFQHVEYVTLEDELLNINHKKQVKR